MTKRNKRESGAMIVEATIVFPVMFLVIFLMIFAGNAFYQKCRVDSFVNQYAIIGASYCADPLLDEVELVHEKNDIGLLPNHKDVDIQPYRYFIGGMDDIESEIKDSIEKQIKNMHTGLFSYMKPSLSSFDAKYNNGFIYSTFSVEVEYKICLPVRLLGERDFMYMHVSSRTDMPVSDTSEFIRNVDMVEDYLQRSGALTAIENAINKAKEWFKK